ncbi:MAG: YkgJ family cysteine cluster protein [Candidatus Sericytochromatia bacterium]|nr:YkgJ family cysteine cluster protein [Candidatus Sericytochromatia bacterium]
MGELQGNDPLSVSLMLGYYLSKLTDVTNLGQSHDDKDLYWLLGQVTRTVSESLPEFLCGKGCSGCCRGDSLPIVSALEWQTLYEHLLQLTPTTQAQIIAETLAQYGAFLHMLLPGRLGYMDGETFRIVPKAAEATVHCPLLVDNACSIYAGRPLTCRTFGHFVRLEAGEYDTFMCDMAKVHVASVFPTGTTLPVANPYEQHVQQLAGRADTRAMLPLWIMAHTAGNAFQPHINLDPDFDALVAGLQVREPD